MASATLSLKISVAEKNLTKTMQFEPSMTVYDACKIIREKVTEANLTSSAKEYGLFLTDEDPKKGVWLEPGRALEYYLLRTGDLLEYRRKMRALKVRMLDGTVKTVLIDDSQPVANLMVVICTKIGITNHDEYALVRDLPDENKENGNVSHTGTLTLKRDKKDKDKTLDNKMEQLKKKLKTDDDLNWVDHSKTLREQGIDDEETLLLRRKFFFSDQNIDSRDPIQLNLLYVQARDAIIAGTHPVTIDEACQFAGLQCQIQFGDHVETKHKAGFLDLKEFLPKDYAKNKGIEKKLFSEHRKHGGNSELDAKVKYVQLARSLKTYGVTFFLVKEKMKGKNKLVPRLLGVTKDSVLRLDEKTKEILKTWPLTTVKRWAASPNSFTLDFGDYSDSYYSVQTTEGEQISQLIAGYIDIILKRKKAKDHFGIEGDEGSTMVEDSVSPYKATILQHQPAQKPSFPDYGNIAKPAVVRAADGPQPFMTGQMPGIQVAAVKGNAVLGHSPGVEAKQPKIHTPDLSEPQRALLSTISASKRAIEIAERDLQTKAKLPELNNDAGSIQWKQMQMDAKKQNVTSHISAMNAATAQIINLTSVPEEEIDNPALGAAVATITNNIPEMSKDVRVIAALVEDDDKGEKLLEATRNLCNAFSDLLKAAEPGTKVPRQSLLNAASRVGETTQSLLYTIGEEEEYDKETSDILLSLAKAVANAAAALVLKAKDVASKCEDQPAQNKVISAATQCALATSLMVACAKVVSPTIHHPTCQRQLAGSSKEVAKAVENIVYVCQDSVKDENLNNKLRAAAAAVSQALNDLLNHVKTLGDHRVRRVSEREGAVDTILDATDRLFSSTGDAPEMVRHAKVLAKATAQLISDIKGQAEDQPDSDIQRRLLQAARMLADATARLVEAAKGCATNPNDSDSQVALKQAAEDLRKATNTAATNALNRKIVHSLEVTKHISTVTSTQNTVQTNGHGPNNNKNQINHEELNKVCNEVAETIPKECDAAIRNIQRTRSLLENTSQPINNSTYFECLEVVMEKSRKLGNAMPNITACAKKSDIEFFVESIKEASESISGLIETTAQSAYLVGAADSSSIAGRPGLVDISSFHRASDAIQVACQQLSNRSSNQQQILSAATIIAKHTSSLCNSCRTASSKTQNPVAKRQFVQSAKDVANATASLVKEIKALDLDPKSERNRQNCAAATKPLIEAVENLTAFASSPEFAVVPAKISGKAKASQEPIISAGRSLIDSSCNMILTSKSLVLNPKDPPGWQTFSGHSKIVSDSIKRIVASIKDSAPGLKECDYGVEKLSACMRELDQATLNIISQNMQSRKDNTLKGFREALITTVSEMSSKVDPLRIAGKCEAENIGHGVNKLLSYFDPLVQNAIACATRTTKSKQQMAILDQTKTICECALQLLYSIKDCGGNPKANSFHNDIDENSDLMKEALNDLLRSLESSSTEEDHMNTIITSITNSISKIDEKASYTSNASMLNSFNYVDYQIRMVNTAKELAKIAQDMVSKSTTNVEQLGPLTANLSHNYGNLVVDASGAISSTTNLEVAHRMRSSVQELGTACVDMTKAAGACQINPGDTFCHRDIAENAKILSEKVSFVLAALQAGSRGTQACINAASTVNGIIGDLDTTIMFATAGTLNPENENETFSDHRENILKTAKALVEDTKTLVAGAASSQEQLAVAAQNAVTTIVQLAEVVKLGAASLGSNNSEAQVLLLNAVKDVASALGELIHATKSASGKSVHDPSMTYLKEAAKVMVTNVTSLLKTVKTVEDEHQRGTRALEATIEAIGQEIRAFDSNDVPTRKATPEDLVRVTKPVTLATAKAVAAGTSGKQDDVIVAANMGRKAIFDLLVTSKQAAFAAETPDLKTRVLESSRNCGLHYRELLQMVHQVIQRPAGASTEAKQQLIAMSRTIATSVTEIVSSAEMLKGTDWVDPDDPTVIAETELLGAASSIEAAARKLASLQPRRTSIKLPHEDMNFDEIILEAAKSITAATAALVKAASAAQRELVATGRVSGRPSFTSDDGQWSEGLISAARHVAAATHSLVEAANALVQGQASEEKLISSAKQVASSTAQLLVACKVKADPDSESMRRLQAAGNAVKKATDNLVRAAQQVIEHEEEQNFVISKKGVSGITQEIVAREQILKKERELEQARQELHLLRQAKYSQQSKQEYSEYQMFSSTTTSSS